MRKSDLMKQLGRQFPEISLAEARLLMDLFLQGMKEGLKSGDTIELRDFGVLRVRLRPERNSRNPKTGEKIVAHPKKVVYFRQSRSWKKEWRDPI